MPDDGRRYEVLNGSLYMAPAPNRTHQRISRNLCRIIYDYLHRHKIGEAYDAPFDVYFDSLNVVQPDLVYVSNAQKDVLVAEGVRGTPDLVVEILSPGTTKRDLRDKLDLYVKSGVREIWIISPTDRSVRVYLPHEFKSEPARVLSESEVLKSPFFPGLAIPCEEIFEE